MVNKINIYGSSGSGKTRFITENAFSGINFVTKLENRFGYHLALSMLPLPFFQGSIESYLKMFGYSEHNFRKKHYELSELLGLNETDILQRDFRSLSAGEKRRLDIFRCIMKSKFVIIDEPFSNSSEDYHDKISDIIEKYCKNIICLSHCKLDNYHNIHISNSMDLQKYLGSIT